MGNWGKAAGTRVAVVTQGTSNIDINCQQNEQQEKKSLKALKISNNKCCKLFVELLSLKRDHHG